MTNLKLRLSAVAVALAVSGMASNAVAGGFGIGTQSGSGTGNAFAGGAAVADDASVAWSNPAAMTMLPTGKQVTVAGHILVPSFKFTNGGSTGAFAAPGTGDGGDGGGVHVVPNMFFAMDINPQLRFGFAVNAPFGLATEYDTGWRGRMTGIESEIKSVNLNPSLAYKVSDMVSIGGGVSVQKIDAKLSAFTGAGATGNLTLDADDIGYGFNLGLLAQVTPSTRVGFTYRSQISYDLEGTANYSGPAGSLFNVKARADLKVPETVSLSVFSAMGSKWEVMADLTHTGWSSVKRLDVIRTTASIGPPPAGGAAGSTITSLLFNWKDTLRIGVGANYKVDERTKLRFGLAFDPTPTNDVDRTPRLPDQDRTWLAFGVQYKPSKEGVLEVGYAHEFVKDARISATTAVTPGQFLNGTFRNKADILSVQYSHRF
ncbi:MAG: outer membrane protein transport protein [Burkholderiales bacterium]|nr:outer membrane protein transport protein [Burkholderiales bacterium]